MNMINNTVMYVPLYADLCFISHMLHDFQGEQSDAQLSCLNSRRNTKEIQITLYYIILSGADPGFPVGGHQPSLEGAPTSNTDAFW